MSNTVDLSELAIDRGEPANRTRRPRHLGSRYVLPGVLVGGFVALVTWSGWELVFPPREVTVIPVLATNTEITRSGAPLFKAAGWIEPRPTAIRVAALAPGVVSRLLVVEDQAVSAGEPVASMIDEDARLVCRRAQANLTLQEAQLAEADARLQAATTRFEQPVHLSAQLAAAEAQLAEVETELTNLPFATRRAEAELDFARQDLEGKLAAEGAVTGRSIDQARSQHEAAQALVEELRNRRASLEGQSRALRDRSNALRTQLSLLADETQAKEEARALVRAAQARVEQARVAADEAKLRLDRMTVRAPVDGRVYELIGVPGTTLTAGMSRSDSDGSTVVTMYQPEMLQVRVDVRFENIPQVTLGQPVEIDNPALTDPITGHVLFVSSEADIQKNTLEVKVAIDIPTPVFKPEMLVDVTYLAPETEGSERTTSDETRLFVPGNLVQQDESGSFVWVADQSEQRARKTRIETGPSSNGGLIPVPTGLRRTSRLIEQGADGLLDGERIRVTGESSSTEAGKPQTQATLSRLPQTAGE